MYKVRQIGKRWAICKICLWDETMGESHIKYYDDHEKALIDCEKLNNGLIRG